MERGAVMQLVVQGGWEGVGRAVPARHVHWLLVSVCAGVGGAHRQKLQPHVLTVVLLCQLSILLVSGGHLRENSVMDLLLLLSTERTSSALLLRVSVLDACTSELGGAAAAAGHSKHACV